MRIYMGRENESDPEEDLLVKSVIREDMGAIGVRREGTQDKMHWRTLLKSAATLHTEGKA